MSLYSLPWTHWGAGSELITCTAPGSASALCSQGKDSSKVNENRLLAPNDYQTFIADVGPSSRLLKTVNVVSPPAILFWLPPHPFSPPLLLDVVLDFLLGFSRSFLVLQLPKSDPTSVLLQGNLIPVPEKVKGVGSTETGMVGGCEPPCGCRGPTQVLCKISYTAD